VRVFQKTEYAYMIRMIGIWALDIISRPTCETAEYAYGFDFVTVK